MKKYILLSIFALFSIITTFAQSSFPLKKGAATGVLDNGVKYYVYSTDSNKGKITLAMNVDTGSSYETQEEIGVAHYLEHLCSSSVPGCGQDSMMHYIYGGGLDLFADYAAFTNNTNTRYSYTYPKESLDTEAFFFKYLGGVISKMEFSVENVERERSIIIKETYSSFTSTDRYAKGGYFENHSVLGSIDHINKITPEIVDGFYKKWYRPDNIVLVLVGDAPLKELEQKIKDNFNDVKVVVDAPVAKSDLFLPKDVSNVYLSSDKNRGEAMIKYYFPIYDFSTADGVKKTIASEIASYLISGIVSNNRRDITSSLVSICNSPRTSIVNFQIKYKDSLELKSNIMRVADAISTITNHEADIELVNRIKKEKRVTMKYQVTDYDNLDNAKIVGNIFKTFSYNLPFTNKADYNKLIDDIVPTITTKDIQNAAKDMFAYNYTIVAEAGKISDKLEKEILDEYFSRLKRTDINKESSFYIGNVMAPRYSDDRKQFDVKKPTYNYKLVAKHKSLDNNVEYYKLKNGFEFFWNNNFLNSEAKIVTRNGYLSLNERESYSVKNTNNIDPLVAGLKTSREIDAFLRKWNVLGTKINVGKHATSIKLKLENKNIDLALNYISLIYKGFDICSDDYSKIYEPKRRAKKDNQKPVENIDKSKLLSKDSLEMALNSLLVPKQTTLYIQGSDIDIEQIIAYMADIPARKSLKEAKPTDIEAIEKTVVATPGPDLKRKNVILNQTRNFQLKKMDLRTYLVQGMLAEYMSQRINLVIREEKGLVYSWGTGASSEMLPTPHTTLSLRFRISPEKKVFNTGLNALNELCQTVIKDGITEYDLTGLKRREINRFFTNLNNEESSMSAMIQQKELFGKIISEDDIRKELDRINLKYINNYFKEYLSLPSKVTFR